MQTRNLLILFQVEMGDCFKIFFRRPFITCENPFQFLISFHEDVGSSLSRKLMHSRGALGIIFLYLCKKLLLVKKKQTEKISHCPFGKANYLTHVLFGISCRHFMAIKCGIDSDLSE